MRGSRLVRLAGPPLVFALVLTSCSSGHTGTGGATPPSSAASVRAEVVAVTPATLSGTTPLVVRFRSALSDADPFPTLSPAVPGRWSRAGSTATFSPSQAYPPDIAFRVTLPGAGNISTTIGRPVSAPGSMRFAEQILARLHYLPLRTTAAPPADAAAEAAAVYQPPPGRFSWRYPDTPEVIQHDWDPAKTNVVLRAAVIAFQHWWHLTQDGAIGPQTWQALVQADLDDAVDPDQYSFVAADLYPRPQTLTVWVDGHVVLTSPVNGGVPAAPTPLGTFPVYLRYTATTMQGTNPDGTKYKDKGVPWVNYFTGGSAVHGFPRASYGYPQSVGCLELPIPTAKTVYGLIDYGTLVNVTGPYVPPPKVASPAAPSPSPTGSSSPTPTGSATALPAGGNGHAHASSYAHDGL
jgi:lipoprotein-anchoring transpeptidase ErfK/SrfK